MVSKKKNKSGQQEDAADPNMSVCFCALCPFAPSSVCMGNSASECIYTFTRLQYCTLKPVVTVSFAPHINNTPPHKRPLLSSRSLPIPTPHNPTAASTSPVPHTPINPRRLFFSFFRHRHFFLFELFGNESTRRVLSYVTYGAACTSGLLPFPTPH